MYMQKREYATLQEIQITQLTMIIPAGKLELSSSKPIYSVGLHFSVTTTTTEVSMKAKPSEAAAQDIYPKLFQQVHFVHQS
jgi:hypothetical protein